MNLRAIKIYGLGATLRLFGPEAEKEAKRREERQRLAALKKVDEAKRDFDHWAAMPRQLAIRQFIFKAMWVGWVLNAFLIGLGMGQGGYLCAQDSSAIACVRK